MPAPHRSESGFALLLVFVMAATVGIMLYLELPRVAFEAQRQREELLIERGEQYKRAIQLYVRKLKKYPATLDELEKSQSGRFLRRRYKDPMTGKDEWRLINIDAAGNFTNSLTQKPPAEGEKKAENLNTFIGEGPPIGGGAAVPGQPQGGAALAAQRRPSDRPLMPASNIPGLPGQPAEQFQAGGAPPPPYGTAPAQPQPYPVAVYPQAQPGQPQPYPYSNLPGQPYPQQTAPGYTPPPGYPTAPGAQPGVPPGFPGQPQPTQIQPGFPGQPQAYPAPVAPGQAPVPFIPGFPAQPQNPQGQPQAYPSPQQPGYPTAPQYGSAYPTQPASSQTGGVVPAPFPTAYPTRPGTGGAPAVGGSPFGQPGTRPGAGAPNPALEMIQRALISPRPGGLSGQSGFGSQVMGGGIAGVASTVEAEGIKVYNEHTKYNEWEFIYDPKKDRTVMGNVAGVPGQGLAAGQGSPERTTEPSKFGTSFGSQEGQPQREPGRSPRPRRRR